ncbi:MAG: hypothetical protein V1839_03820 [archaeon]
MAYHNRQRQPYAGIPHAPEDIVNRLNVFSPDVLKGPAFVHPLITAQQILETVKNSQPEKLYGSQAKRFSEFEAYKKRDMSIYEEENYIEKCGILKEFKGKLPEAHFMLHDGFDAYAIQKRLKSNPKTVAIRDDKYSKKFNVTKTKTELGTPYLEFLPYTILSHPPNFSVTDNFNHETYSAPILRLELDGFSKPNYRGLVEGHPIAMALQIATNMDAPLETRISQTLDKSEYPNCVVRGIEHAQKNCIYFPNWVVPFSKTFVFSDKASLCEIGENLLQLKNYEGEVDVKGEYVFDSFFGKFIGKDIRNAIVTKNLEEKLLGSVQETYFGNLGDTLKNTQPQQTQTVQESGGAGLGVLLIGGIITSFVGGAIVLNSKILGENSPVCGIFMIVGAALGLAGLFASMGYYK